jgi:transposase
MFSVELYGRVRHACHVEGVSQREAARRFGIHRNTVRKMPAFSAPPGYRPAKPPPRQAAAPPKTRRLHGYHRPDRDDRPISAAEAAAHGQAHL